MIPLNQPGSFFTTAKTHKIECTEDISLHNLKLRSIIDQTGTYMQNTSAFLSKNEFSNIDTLSLPKSLKNISNDESSEDVSHNVKSFFTSIPVQETIDYILQRILVRNGIQQFCRKSIFKTLLLKLSKKCVFSFNNRLIKQIGGFPMKDPNLCSFFRYSYL